MSEQRTESKWFEVKPGSAPVGETDPARQAIAKALEKASKALTPKERDLVRKRYGYDLPEKKP